MDKLQKLFLPTRIELVVYGILTVLIFAASSLSSLFDTIAGDKFGEEVRQVFNDGIDNFLEQVSQFQLSAQASLILFWVIFAVVLYVVINVAHNLWVEARNDVVVESNFVHPEHYTHDNFWLLLAQRSLFRLGMAIIMIAYTFAVINLLLPIWIQLFNLWINNLTSPMDWLGLIIAVIGVSVTLHLYVVFTRLFLMRVRIMDES